MTRLAELKEKQASLKAEMLAESKAAFSEISKSLFEKYPKLESFSWTQYTPYFNDGDECTFSAHTDNCNVLWDKREIEGLSPYTFESSYVADEVKQDAELKAFSGDVAAMFKDIEEPMLKEMFGDHCKVTAHRTGVTVDGYSHD